MCVEAWFSSTLEPLHFTPVCVCVFVVCACVLDNGNKNQEIQIIAEWCGRAQPCIEVYRALIYQTPLKLCKRSFFIWTSSTKDLNSGISAAEALAFNPFRFVYFWIFQAVTFTSKDSRTCSESPCSRKAVFPASVGFIVKKEWSKSVF